MALAAVKASSTPVPSKEPLQKLIIYALHTSAWTARGKDDDVTAIAKGATNVDQDVDAGNFIKHYLDCPELKAVLSYLNSKRNEWYDKTAPWGEIKNVRAGKVDGHMERMSWVGDVQEGLAPLLQALGDKYDERVEEARFTLQGMWKAENYPPRDEVLRRFSFTVKARPLANVNDIRVLTEIPLAERQRLEKEVLAEKAEAMKESLQYALAKLLKPVANLATQLDRYNKGETKRLFETLTENVSDMCEAAMALNLTDDPIVTQFAVEARSMVKGISQKDLKDSDLLRSAKAKEAADLAERIGKFFL